MATVNLTDAWLRAIKPTTTRMEFRDSRTPGLAVRITPNGTITFAVRARGLGGAEHRVTLGSWPVFPLAKARRESLELLARIKAGGDPTAERVAVRVASQSNLVMPTVKERWNEWLTQHDRRWSLRYCQEVRRIGNRHVLDAFGARALSAVNRTDWIALIAHMRDKPALASSIYRIVNSFLSYSEAAGWIEEHPLPRKGAARIAPTVPARDRVLTDAEIAAIWRATQHVSLRVQCFVQLMTATGCRESEAAGIAVGEVDFTTGIWTLPAARSKNRKTHAMPLPDLLAAQLLQLKPVGDRGQLSGYRLLGRDGNPLSGFSKIKVGLDAISDVSEWRFHDLRRTCRSGLAALGVAADIAERCLNHVPQGIVAVYDRHSYREEVLRGLRRWQQKLSILVGEASHVSETLRPHLSLSA